MDEGINKDDRYRMVEDEFLSVAQKFTVHLHAAEYKRRQKTVESRKAETIPSISRPVTGRMPDQTRRKVEAVALSKTQTTALEGILSKKPENGEVSDDSDDADGLPYVGTTLHGLMDSPRKKVASLVNMRATKATTRAAAGFKRPAAPKDENMRSLRPEVAIRHTRVALSDYDRLTASSENDDDLDAPIPALKLRVTSHSNRRSSFSNVSTVKRAITATEMAKFDATAVNPSASAGSMSEEFPSLVNTVKSSSATTSHRPSRLERVRRQRLVEEKTKEEQIKTKLDMIPIFL